MTHEEMAAELTKAGWNVSSPVDQKTCRHWMRQGTGTLRSYGSYEYSFYCPTCKAHGHSKGGPNPEVEQKLILWS